MSAKGAVDLYLYGWLGEGDARANTRNQAERWGTYSVPFTPYGAATGNIRWNDDGEIEQIWVCGQNMVVKAGLEALSLRER